MYSVMGGQVHMSYVENAAETQRLHRQAVGARVSERRRQAILRLSVVAQPQHQEACEYEYGRSAVENAILILRQKLQSATRSYIRVGNPSRILVRAASTCRPCATLEALSHMQTAESGCSPGVYLLFMLGYTLASHISSVTPGHLTVWCMP